jgi:hypothetical protein
MFMRREGREAVQLYRREKTSEGADRPTGRQGDSGLLTAFQSFAILLIYL